MQGGLNTYGYVGVNPLSYVDPLGLLPSDYAAVEQIVRKYADAVGVRTPSIYGIGLSERDDAGGVKGVTDLTDKDRPVRIHDRYWDKCLTDAQAADLLNTYIHETVHFNSSALDRFFLKYFQDKYQQEGVGNGIGDRIHDSIYSQARTYTNLLNREFQALRREFLNEKRDEYMDPDWGYPEVCECLK